MGGGGSKEKCPDCCPDPPECDCSEAAETVLNRLEDAKTNAGRYSQIIAQDTVAGGDGFNVLKDIINSQPQFSSEAQQAREKWKNMQPTFQESFKNKEGMDNMNVMEYIKDGIATRHAAFREISTFSEDCEIHGYTIISKFLNQEKQDLDLLLKYYKTFLTDYQSLYQYKSSVSSIIQNKNSELNKIQNDINNYKKNLFIDDRKNDYKQENYKFYQTIWFYLLIVYYSLFVIYLIFSKFIQDKLYLDKKILFFLAVYLILPIILRYILNFIVELFIYYLESNNIKQEVQSYADIIKNNDESASN